MGHVLNTTQCQTTSIPTVTSGVPNIAYMYILVIPGEFNGRLTMCTECIMNNKCDQKYPRKTIRKLDVTNKMSVSLPKIVCRNSGWR